MIYIDINVIFYFSTQYRNPTILETVSIASESVKTDNLFIEIQRQGIILAPMCLCKGKMWK